MQILVLGESSLVGVSIYHQMLGGGEKDQETVQGLDSCWGYSVVALAAFWGGHSVSQSTMSLDKA